MELDDGARLSAQFEQAGWLSPQARMMILEIDPVLANRSGSEHSEFSSLESLRTCPDWVQIRRLAREALTAI